MTGFEPRTSGVGSDRSTILAFSFKRKRFRRTGFTNESTQVICKTCYNPKTTFASIKVEKDSNFPPILPPSGARYQHEGQYLNQTFQRISREFLTVEDSTRTTYHLSFYTRSSRVRTQVQCNITILTRLPLRLANLSRAHKVYLKVLNAKRSQCSQQLFTAQHHNSWSWQ